MPYSAVTQPSPLPRRKPGTRFSTLAVHSTRVSPKLTSSEPSAWRVKARSMRTSRHWLGARPLGRAMEFMGRSRNGGREAKVEPAPDLICAEEHTSELRSLMRHSYAVFCLKNNYS